MNAPADKPIHFRSLSESDWIGGWDLPERGAVVVIESVERFVPLVRRKKENPRTGQKEEEKVTSVVIRLKNQKKAFIANRTCQNAIAAMYTPDIRKWVGKPIHIYYDPTVMLGRKVVGGIRVSPTVPQRGQRPTETQFDTPPDPERVKAIEEAKAAADAPAPKDDRGDNPDAY